ncbi:hypothetical protein TMEN_6068 [Trichophyton mentagrophytes]|uniref:Uncharacterized protein n=1 Tax=Trichophyton interdigitale (strain MR816) TaxID=1215338 RepID=A0A059J2Z4_TRIIM|nr:hypothetical protein H101_00852 [Trichophyton interdigitale H6]KDB22164.1 hypothetical protein H109_05953 [Trichophyton interdigitale MR816]GBF63443.1 hypothetical protein TMEN_6068 [Trichophyton mentagrophytes]
MVLLTATPGIISAIKALPLTAREELSLAETPSLNDPISHEQLISIARRLSSHPSRSTNTGEEDDAAETVDSPTCEGSKYTLNSLLRGAKLYIPPPPPKPAPSPEYLALKAKLLAEAEQNQYNSLLHPLSPSESKRQPAAIFASRSSRIHNGAKQSVLMENDESDPITPSLVLNILVSILFTGFATYWGLSNFRIPKLSTLLPWSERPSSLNSDPHAYYYYPHAPSSQPFRVFVSLFIGILVGVAEVVVYASYLRKVANAKAKEKAKVEKKVFIGLVEDPPHDKSQVPAKVSTSVSLKDGEKEEIWGKGVNGGARRRVRDKWREKENRLEQE